MWVAYFLKNDLQIIYNISSNVFRMGRLMVPSAKFEKEKTPELKKQSATQSCRSLPSPYNSADLSEVVPFEW